MAGPIFSRSNASWPGLNLIGNLGFPPPGGGPSKFPGLGRTSFPAPGPRATPVPPCPPGYHASCGGRPTAWRHRRQRRRQEYLLKILAGVYAPTTGRRRVEGRIGSLFELLVGFDPDSTGRENICFRGYLQGETPRSLSRVAGEIADFAELGQFLDMPVRCYSSGMLVRLAFAIATAINPEVLLIDEFLSAGGSGVPG